MSERKILNRYYDYKIQYQKKKFGMKNPKKFFFIRFMVPFDIICSFCKIIFQKGTKINAIKEKIKKEHYIGIHIFRFYFKCLNCNIGITLKTNPKNLFYVPEKNCKYICFF
jgi:hypothetical protein